MRGTGNTLFLNRLTQQIDRWWAEAMFKPELGDQLDPETMTIDEISRIIKRRFPLTRHLELVHQSANVTFRSGKYIFKVPVGPAARQFSAYEAQIVNTLPCDPHVEFPRIYFGDVPIPISKHRMISGIPLRDLISEQTVLPRGLAHSLGKAIALLHSCKFHGELRRVLVQQRHDIGNKTLEDLEKQLEVGRQKQASYIDTSFLDRLSSESFVFCHGDMNSGNIIVTPSTGEKLGIIDFGQACYNAREFDFAPLKSTASRHLGDQFFNDTVEAYEKHSGHALDIDLIEKFTSLRKVVQRRRRAWREKARRAQRRAVSPPDIAGSPTS